MAPVTAADGPVAVTGCAGFIGSHVVQNLVQHGYNVRACVRDSSRLDKVAHLVDMGSKGPGSVTLYDCDMFVDGAYDEAFKGVTCVYHVAAELGSTEGATPQSVYDGGMVATQKVLDSVIKSGAPGTPSVQRFIFTSSFAAVGHPGAPALGGPRLTEADWADMNTPADWADNVAYDRDIAYAKTKADTERLCYSEAEKHGFEAFGVMPCHVLGPLLCKDHGKPFMWQTRIGDMLDGYGHARMYWNITDVRDIAETQRLIGESTANKNGDRYNLVAPDESGLMTQLELADMLRGFYPGYGIGDHFRDGNYGGSKETGSVLEKCLTQLDLTPHTVEQTVLDTANSLIIWGMVNMREGEDNYQRQGNDCGLPEGGKWSPRDADGGATFPAMANAPERPRL